MVQNVFFLVNLRIISMNVKMDDFDLTPVWPLIVYLSSSLASSEWLTRLTRTRQARTSGYSGNQ